MGEFALSMPDGVHREVTRLADKDEQPMNEWIVSAIERETIRRGLLAHNEYVKNNPSYSIEQWEAEEADEVEALRAAGQ